MVKRVIVGAHYGLRDWMAQRVTAAVIAGYTLYMLALVIAQPPVDFLTWRSLFTHTWVRVPTLVALLCIYLHAWVGVRDILMDYIKPTALRLVLQIGVIVALFAYAAWTVQILWSL
jgi:succinate dehydrogenase / fumarate reductase membrane anchor subunit